MKAKALVLQDISSPVGVERPLATQVSMRILELRLRHTISTAGRRLSQAGVAWCCVPSNIAAPGIWARSKTASQ